jgi:SET domain-containing protein
MPKSTNAARLQEASDGQVRATARALHWVDQEDGTELGIRGRNALRFINHSTTPNCAFHSDELTAIAPIQPGQELTCHYGEEWV